MFNLSSRGKNIWSSYIDQSPVGAKRRTTLENTSIYKVMLYTLLKMRPTVYKKNFEVDCLQAIAITINLMYQ